MFNLSNSLPHLITSLRSPKLKPFSLSMMFIKLLMVAPLFLLNRSSTMAKPLSTQLTPRGIVRIDSFTVLLLVHYPPLLDHLLLDVLLLNKHGILTLLLLLILPVHISNNSNRNHGKPKKVTFISLITFKMSSF